jgi:hypothetical protein
MAKDHDPGQPDAPKPAGRTPAGTPASQLGAFARGLKVAFSVPAALLFSAGLGFGALARDGGFSLGHTAFIAGTMFALPNQVVLIDQLARDEALLAVAFAVALAALRLLPMTVTVTPLLKGDRPRPLMEALAVHFVAVSPWIESHRRLPALPPSVRLASHLGHGVAFWSAMLTGTVGGYALAGSRSGGGLGDAPVPDAHLFPAVPAGDRALAHGPAGHRHRLRAGAHPLSRRARLRSPGHGRARRDARLPAAGAARVSFLADGFGGYLTLVLAGFLATEVWRWIGLALGSRLDVGGAPFQWVRAVATALVSGLVTRMLLFPTGALVQVPLLIRLAAFAGGVSLYFLLRRNLAAGVGGAAALLMAAQLIAR